MKKLCIWMLLLLAVSCGPTEPVPLAEVLPNILSPTLVSVNTTSSEQAEVVLKTGSEFGATDWHLTMTDASDRPVALSINPVLRLGLFNIVPCRVTGLRPEQTYRLRMRTRNAGGDSVRIERTYTHRTSGPRWLRLAHAPIDQGDFAGTAMSTDNITESEETKLLSVSQNGFYAKRLDYLVPNNEWVVRSSTTGGRSHRTVRYRLQAEAGLVYDFAGLGFLSDELRPGQRQYLKSMVSSGLVVPFYAGPDGELRWFATRDRAYQLTDGSQELWVRQGNWAQYRTADLPEPTGTLATFRIGSTGYAVNQRSGQPAHLWAFDTKTEQWSRRADFPGPARSLGVGFTVAGNAYFGLGINPNEETLRDIWQYDPLGDRWQYVTDYPGQGSTYVVVAQMQRGRTFLGWGYEQQPTGVGAFGW
ncbi:hypothetical protein [Spirosoma montaniterrae]|uniref:Fibronectin type-III domain-containing protein n=1 Tax=Spirosoma montaniterrae TaxID=1178516 RepID=A0A1P9WVU9_9BACT|nr:hypothetical protein [Spirosoma montaniterrae]AQG79514.1 hypothetical protein AWR27_09390 [Spirosoma montaniterrae]